MFTLLLINPSHTWNHQTFSVVRRFEKVALAGVSSKKLLRRMRSQNGRRVGRSILVESHDDSHTTLVENIAKKNRNCFPIAVFLTTLIYNHYTTSDFSFFILRP